MRHPIHEYELFRVKQLLATNLLSEVDKPYTQSVFIELILRLDSLLQLLNREGRRINFTDDVDLPENESADITDLVNKVNNAIKHEDTTRLNRDSNDNVFAFNRLIGANNSGISVNGEVTETNPYSDDTAFYYGPYRIYLNRHIKKCLDHVDQAMGA
jgi:hypothetical protein